MTVRHTLQTPPATEPVSVDTAKAHLRWTHSTEDALLASYIAGARSFLENWTRRAFISQVWRTYLDRWPDARGEFAQANGLAIHLARGPLISVDSVTYTDTAGASQVLAPSLYDVESGAMPPRIWPAYDATWPSVREGVNSIVVEYTVGHASAAAFVAAEPALTGAMLLLIGHYASNREAVVTGTITSELQLAVEALAGPRIVF